MTDLPIPPYHLVPEDLRGDDRRVRRERGARVLLLSAALVSIVVSALIVVSLAGQAWTFISQVEWSALRTDGWFPRRGQYDIATIVVGTLLVTGVAMAVAIPLGLGAAVYLAEYARPRVRKFLKPALEVLAGVPSVVVGFFALSFISPEVVQRFAPGATQFSLLAAGLGVGVLVIPLVASVSEDAMASVPTELRHASAALGARKVTTTVRAVVPAAVSGLVASFIVAASRAVGETMVVFIAAGATGGSLFSTDVLRPGQTMTAAMASQASGTDQVRGAGLTFQSLFFVGILLFVVTLLLNVAANRFVRRVREKY